MQAIDRKMKRYHVFLLTAAQDSYWLGASSYAIMRTMFNIEELV